MGLYGRMAERDGPTHCVLVEAAEGPGVGLEAAAASSSRSDGGPPAGDNVGIGGNVAWSGIVPSGRGDRPYRERERGGKEVLG